MTLPVAGSVVNNLKAIEPTTTPCPPQKKNWTAEFTSVSVYKSPGFSIDEDCRILASLPDFKLLLGNVELQVQFHVKMFVD